MAPRSDKREELKARLVAAARGRIEAQGVRGLRARDITSDAGCALGGLYNAFADLQDLIIHVNGETLDALEARLSAAVLGAGPDPRERLEALALAYLDFAGEHRALWFALFDLASLADTTIPDWHRDQQRALVELIAEPLRAIETELDPSHLAARAQALFAAVHGIVTLSLEERTIGLSGEPLAHELRTLVQRMTTVQS